MEAQARGASRYQVPAQADRLALGLRQTPAQEALFGGVV